MEGEKQRRRKYDREFKIQAVKFLLESGKTVEEIFFESKTSKL